MAVVKRFRVDNEADHGEWFTWRTIPAEFEAGRQVRPEEVIAYQIRAIPEIVSNRIERQHLGNESVIAFEDDRRIMGFDNEKTRAVQIAKALYALRDSRNNDIVVEDSEALELVHKTFQDAKIGDTIRLDGHWTDDLKRTVLLGDFKFRIWVLKKAEELGAIAGGAEAGKGKTS